MPWLEVHIAAGILVPLIGATRFGRLAAPPSRHRLGVRRAMERIAPFVVHHPRRLVLLGATQGRIDQSRVYVVRYDRMMRDFDVVMEEMCEFLGKEMTPELRATVLKRADKQRAYKSGHKYDLEKFGLSEEKILKDCAFFYETFLPPLEPEAPKPRAEEQAATAQAS